jgi:hypothetical protein
MSHPIILYIASHGPAGPCKIGITTNDKMRFAQIQTGSPVRIIPEWSLACNNAPNLERRMHAAFADKRLKGEWFDITPKEADAMLDIILTQGCY